jgi:Ca2+-binding RTX toxin-like protein
MHTMLKTLAVAGAVAAPLLFVASPAHAFTNVSVTGGTLSISSTDARDDIRISRSGGFVVVENRRDALIPSSPCTTFGRTVRCPSGSVNRISINVKGGDDIVGNGTSLPTTALLGAGFDTYNGGSGADTVSAGVGRDTLNGNGGNDVLLGGADVDRANGGIGLDRCTAENETACELN